MLMKQVLMTCQKLVLWDNSRLAQEQLVLIAMLNFHAISLQERKQLVPSGIIHQWATLNV